MKLIGQFNSGDCVSHRIIFFSRSYWSFDDSWWRSNWIQLNTRDFLNWSVKISSNKSQLKSVLRESDERIVCVFVGGNIERHCVFAWNHKNVSRSLSFQLLFDYRYLNLSTLQSLTLQSSTKHFTLKPKTFSSCQTHFRCSFQLGRQFNLNACFKWLMAWHEFVVNVRLLISWLLPISVLHKLYSSANIIPKL